MRSHEERWNDAPGELGGRIAIVTGAARGIGAATAELLTCSGATVILSDIDEPALRLVAKSLARAEAYPCDVSRPAAVEDMVRHVDEAHGRLDILVNNAGICPRIPLEEMTEDSFDRLVDINMKSVFFLTRAAARVMKRNGFGRVVNVSSVGGRIGGVVHATVYSATKGAVLAMTRSMAREYAPEGILVNAVAPGAVNTRMFTDIGDEAVDAYVGTVPLRRLAEPMEVARGILDLCRPTTTWITGATIDINGGVLMM